MMKNQNIKKLTLTAVFLALGFILPLFTGQIPQIGSMLLPMHIPVYLCAFVCGGKYAVPMAAVLPLMRSALFLRPMFYPDALAIALELSAYALVGGLIYAKQKKNLGSVYISLIAAMPVGRAVRIVAQLLLLGLSKNPVSFWTVFSAVVLRGIPGILLQLLIIPPIMMLINKVMKEEESTF